MRISYWSSGLCSSDPFARHRFGNRAMRRCQRHGDDGMAVFGDIDAVDQPEIVDVDRDFGIVDFLQCRDHGLVKIAARLAAADWRRFMRQKALQIIGCAIGGQRSEEHTSELQSLMRTSYAVFCLKTKQTNQYNHNTK